MSSTLLPESTTPFTSILVRLCRECDVGVEHLRAEQLLREARAAWPGDERHRWSKWLRSTSESVSLRSRVAQLPLGDALRLAQDGALVVGGCVDSNNVYAIVGFDGRRVELAVGEIDATEKVSVAEFAERLGIATEDAEDREWVVIDRPEMVDAHDARHLHGDPVRRFYRIIRPEWPDIWVILVFAFIAGLLSLSTPIAVESLVNTVAFGQLLQPVVVLAALLFGFLAFAGVMYAMQTYVAEIIQQRLFARVTADLAYRLPRVDPASLGSHYGPEMVNRFLDVVTLQKVSAQLLLDGVGIVLAALVGMAVLAFYHPWLLGFDILLLLAIVGGLAALGRGGVPSAIDESIMKYRITSWLEDLIRCRVGFKLSGGAEFGVDRTNLLTSQYLTARRSHFSVLIRQYVFILALQAVAGTVLLGGGGWLVIQGQLSLGQLVAAELIVTMILGSLAKLFKHLEGFYDVVAAVDKLGHLFDLQVERHDGLLNLPADEPLEVSFSNVTLTGAGSALASGLTADVSAGDRVAIVGSRGSGKTRLLSSLFGLEQPSGGHVTIHGIDPFDLRPDVLREQVALAGEIELFEGTIADNVHLHRPHVSTSDARGALTTVGLLDDLQRFPDGVDTPINASGHPLSASEARLLMLARAIAGQPRLLLVDGLFDALPDGDLAHVLSALTSSDQSWTLLVATSRQDIAQRIDLRISLDEPV